MKLWIVAIGVLAGCGDDGAANPNEEVACTAMGTEITCDRACVDQPLGGTGNQSSECKVTFENHAGVEMGRACTDDEIVVADGREGCCIYEGNVIAGNPFHVYWAACE